MDFVSVTNNKIMKTALKSNLYKLVEIGEVEVFTPAQLKSYVEMSNDSISKSEGSKGELYKSVVDEMRSFEPVTMWDDKDLQKSTVMVRPAQIAWDNKGDDIEKSLSGRFLDTELNRKFDRVGLHYPMVDPIEKAKKAVLGEIREWSDGKYRKTANGWEYIKGSDPNKKVEKLPEVVKQESVKDKFEVADNNMQLMVKDLMGFAEANGLEKGFSGSVYLKGKEGEVVRSMYMQPKLNFSDVKEGKLVPYISVHVGEIEGGFPNKVNKFLDSKQFLTPKQAYDFMKSFKSKVDNFYTDLLK